MKILRKIEIGLLACGLIGLLGCDKDTPPAAPAPPPPPAASAPSSAVAANVWLTSVPDAEAQAKKENKLVLLNFTGSDWCAACKVLDNTVFSNRAFIDFADKNLVLVELDYPFAKKLPEALEKANNQLKTNYDIEGYPTLIALKPDGQSVWTNLGVPDGGVTNVIAQLEKVRQK